MKYGFIAPEITDDNYVLGGLGVNKNVINPLGDWINYLPLGEKQKRNIETSSCTEYGTLNGLETLENMLYGRSPNHSERYISILAGNTETGNDPHKVAETIRKWGLVEEELLPFDDSIASWTDYMSPTPPPNRLTSQGLKWLKTYDFKHEWVFKGGTIEQKQTALLEALKYSPVGVSVQAWQQEGQLYVKNGQDNHWCLLVAGEQGKPWTVYDSYLDDDYLKKLSWNYDFGFAKLYILKKIEKKTFLDFLKRYWEELFR